jgi:heavy metal sensor kinase
MLDLPYDLQARYGESRMPPFFIIWRDDGSVLKVVGLQGELPPRPLDLQPDRVVRLGTAGMREVAILGPGHTTILVGRSIEREQNEMVRLAGQLIFIGVATLGIGLAGGWWLSSRAVAPLESMSQTAASITASNLSKRLDAARLDLELEQLAEILNAMLDRLEAAFRQQVQFTADASHELRTPLSVILTHLEIALSRTRSVEEYREALSVCLRAAQRMKALTENLLTLARADSGRLGLQRRNVDVAMIARECAALLGPLANDRSVSVAVSDGPCEASVDADRIAQVITNLVSNAISYNRPGGTVMIMTTIREDELEIKVTDTGHGIPSQYLPHLFDRFYRMDESRARATGGAGLGLAICKSIVEAHGGRISAESKPNQGTTFTILMPAR